MAFIIDILTFHGKSEHKQVKWNEIKRDICKCDSIFLYLQRGTLFKLLLKFISWQSLYEKWVITVPKEKCSSLNFIPQMLQEIGHI